MAVFHQNNAQKRILLLKNQISLKILDELHFHALDLNRNAIFDKLIPFLKNWF